MHKPSIKSGLLNTAVALLMGSGGLAGMGLGEMREKPQRGPGRRRERARITSKYMPEATVVRNPLVAAQINVMHQKWLTEQFPSRVTKQDPDPKSVTSIKLRRRVHRHVARIYKAHAERTTA